MTDRYCVSPTRGVDVVQHELLGQHRVDYSGRALLRWPAVGHASPLFGQRLFDSEAYFSNMDFSRCCISFLTFTDTQMSP